MKQFKFLVLGILFLVAGFLLGLGINNQPSGPQQPLSAQSEQPARMLIDTGEDILGFNNLAVAEGDTVWSALERAAESREELSVSSTDYGDMGVLIESINGYQNGDNKQYWQFWVNNQYADVAANNYQLSPGDVVLWKFTSSRYESY